MLCGAPCGVPYALCPPSDVPHACGAVRQRYVCGATWRRYVCICALCMRACHAPMRNVRATRISLLSRMTHLVEVRVRVRVRVGIRVRVRVRVRIRGRGRVRG